MRKKMTKQVTKTTVKMAKMIVKNGEPMAVTIPDEVLMGNVTQQSAQTIMNKKHGNGITVLSVQADTNTYEMKVSEFIKYATIKENKEQETK